MGLPADPASLVDCVHLAGPDPVGVSASGSHGLLADASLVECSHLVGSDPLAVCAPVSQACMVLIIVQGHVQRHRCLLSQPQSTETAFALVSDNYIISLWPACRCGCQPLPWRWLSRGPWTPSLPSSMPSMCALCATSLLLLFCWRCVCPSCSPSQPLGCCCLNP